jgi:hypothetical protein
MLGTRVVEAPNGVRWRIGRRWISRPLPRWRRVGTGDAASEAAWSLPDIGAVEDLPAAVMIGVGAIVFAVVLIPLLLFGVELIIAGLLIASGILARAFLGRGWVVRATPAGGEDRALAWRVSGLRRSARLIDEVAASLARGIQPLPAEAAETLLTEMPAPTR